MSHQWYTRVNTIFHRQPEKPTPATRMACERRLKLLAKIAGPFRMMSNTSDTVIIDEDGRHNTVSTNPVSRESDKTELKNRSDKREIS